MIPYLNASEMGHLLTDSIIFYSDNAKKNLQYFEGAYKFPNASCCKDTYWYKCFDLYTSTYTDYLLF